jgi:F0F1-type ATP synthase assembly protein I
MDKLDQLNQRIQSYKKKNAKKTYARSDFKRNAFSTAMEIIAAVAVGLLLGFYMDKLFNLKFTFKMICLLLAFVACMLNIYRTIDRR